MVIFVRMLRRRLFFVSPFVLILCLHQHGTPQAQQIYDLVIGNGHPRSSGTYPRVLGRYVRDQQALPLMDALRKMTIMPAQRLEKRVPAMRNKGRIRVGADADITIFDPARIIDRSTYEKPAELPEGVRFVLVNGVTIVSEEKLVESVVPGRPLRAPVVP